MTDINAVEHEIASIYREFARHRPGVRVPEEGRLKDLWAYADEQYREEN